MSLIVTVCTNEGIVMASDSRITYNNLITGEKGVHFSDTAYKTFMCGENIGISTCGNADIYGVPIAGYIEDFIKNNFSNQDVATTSNLLLEYFNKIAKGQNIHFQIAGYTRKNDKDLPTVYEVYLAENLVRESLLGGCNAFIDGEKDIIFKLFRHGYIVDNENVLKFDNLTIDNEDGTKSSYKNSIVLINNFSELIGAKIAWNLLTLQDAVDFARYTIQTTIETMRFEQRVKTVGGPIDVLIIKPTGAKFLVRKELK